MHYVVYFGANQFPSVFAPNFLSIEIAEKNLTGFETSYPLKVFSSKNIDAEVNILKIKGLRKCAFFKISNSKVLKILLLKRKEPFEYYFWRSIYPGAYVLILRFLIFQFPGGEL